MNDELTILRGAVRDGVAAMENLANVLASRRVGPKVISKALPEVRGGCLALGAALARLQAELVVLLAGDQAGIDASVEMLGQAHARVDELATELERHESHTLDARQRIALDAFVRDVAGELAGVVRLVDVIGAAFSLRTTALELRDVLSQKRLLPGAPSAPVTVSVDFGSAPALLGDAHVVMDLVLFGLSAARRASIGAPHLAVSVEGERLRLDIGRPPATLPTGTSKLLVDVPVRKILPREAEVLAAAARRANIVLSFDPAGPHLALLL